MRSLTTILTFNNFGGMKHLLLLLSIVFSCLFSTVSLAQTTKSVSKDDALAIAQKQFVGKDVDYYVLSNSSSAIWNIFVDAEPMKGWQHDCYVLTIPKSTTVDINAIIPRMVSRKMPPQEDYAPLLVKNRYGSNANSKPQVRKATSSNGNNEAAQRTYAIILSGGVNKNSNYERYWNDCSFIYQTLVNKYSIPKGNIYPIMSDGNNPAADMRSISGGYKSQPLDLDNDGVDKIYLLKSSIPTSEQYISMEVTTNAGELAEALGDNINNVDSLIIHGSINNEDFYTLWNATFNGKLAVINLENATIENKEIPKNAFWHQDIQMNFEGGYIECVHLQKIILPNEIQKIGDGAFSYAINLRDVNLPSHLRSIGTYAFSECVNLKTDPLIFPEGFEMLGNLAFQDCYSLVGRIILPSTIREIGDGAFFQSKISSINLPEGLERIGDAAFYACRLKEVAIPNSCKKIDGDSHFQMNYKLEKVSLPEGMDRIPSSFCSSCLALKEINIPSTVKSIGNKAFWQCRSLKKLDLPQELETIEKEGFWYCDSLEEIIFPKSLIFLGTRSCDYWTNVKRIYCMSSEPPVCEGNERCPFGSYNSDFDKSTPNDIPVYVPVGTAEKYRKAWGWDYFANFIETDDFPTAIHNITIEHSNSNNPIYDLNGREVINPQKGQVYIKNGKKIIFAR